MPRWFPALFLGIGVVLLGGASEDTFFERNALKPLLLVLGISFAGAGVPLYRARGGFPAAPGPHARLEPIEP